jgi:prolipoprotein diacylglyceryl transferase
MTLTTASIPSPSEGVVHLGPLPLRGYALCILIGVIVGAFIAERRLRARGAPVGAGYDIATLAVPLGIIGARLYHVITTPEPYFGKGGHPVDALYIWRGGLGIWGGIAGGFLGAVFILRRRKMKISVAADAFAPALAVAQGIGRWGNWFNQELYGRPSTLPWAVRIDPAHREAAYANVATYQPTFLYESVWCLGVAALCIWADKRFKLGSGRVFALYVASYTAGRAWIEALRVDTAQRFFGLRLNDYVSIIVFLIAVTYLIRRRGRNDRDFDLPAEDGAADPVNLVKASKLTESDAKQTESAGKPTESEAGDDTAGAATTAESAAGADAKVAQPKT